MAKKDKKNTTVDESKIEQQTVEQTEVVEATEKAVTTKASKKSSKATEKKPNFFVRIGGKIAKLCKDIVGEMKKVSWTSGSDLAKNTKLVLVTVVAFGVAIAVIDTLCAFIINSVAGLIG